MEEQKKRRRRIGEGRIYLNNNSQPKKDIEQKNPEQNKEAENEALESILLRVNKRIEDFSKISRQERSMLSINGGKRVDTFVAELKSQIENVKRIDKRLGASLDIPLSEFGDTGSVYHLEYFGTLVNRAVKDARIKKIYTLYDKAEKSGLSENIAKFNKLVSGFSDKDKIEFLAEAVINYKKDRTEDGFNRLNKIMRTMVNKEIKRFPYKETSLDKRRSVRVVFQGIWNIPPLNSPDNDEDYGYSKTFLDYNKNKHRDREIYRVDPYKVNEIQAWREFKKAAAYVGKEVKDITLINAMSAINFPSDVEKLKKLNMFDLGKIMFDYYSFHQFDENNGSILHLDSIDKDLGDFHTSYYRDVLLHDEVKKEVEEDLLKNGVDKEYIKDMFENVEKHGTPNFRIPKGKKYKGKIPRFSLHHKTAIQDAERLGNFAAANDPRNIVMVVDFIDQDMENSLKSENVNHDFYHLTDEPLYVNKGEILHYNEMIDGKTVSDNDRICERIMDVDDGKNNEHVLYASGTLTIRKDVGRIIEESRTRRANNEMSREPVKCRA